MSVITYPETTSTTEAIQNRVPNPVTATTLAPVETTTVTTIAPTVPETTAPITVITYPESTVPPATEAPTTTEPQPTTTLKPRPYSTVDCVNATTVTIEAGHWVSQLIEECARQGVTLTLSGLQKLNPDADLSNLQTGFVLNIK